MSISFTPSTKELLDSVDTLSAHALMCKNDLGIILEMALLRDERHTLEDLAFVAKFVVKAHGIMKRIGREGEGYDKLSSEFNTNLDKAAGLTRTLISSAPIDVQHHFEHTYFAMSQKGLQNLLALFHDLGWYKNWLIDHPDH